MACRKYIQWYISFLSSVTLIGCGSSFMRFLDHTQRRTTVGRTPLDEWPARRRDIYLTKTHNTHNRQDFHAPGGIRTHNPSRLAAVDLRLGPRGHWDRLGAILSVLSYGLFNEDFESLEYAASNGGMAPGQCMATNVEEGGRVLIWGTVLVFAWIETDKNIWIACFPA